MGFDELVNSITQGEGMKEPKSTEDPDPPSTRSWAPANSSSNPPYTDVLNNKDKPNTGTGDKPRLNIDEEGWTETEWSNDDLNLHLPPERVAKDTSMSTGDPCLDNCRDKAEKRKRKCEILRTRVAKALELAGCPSDVIPRQSNNGGCGCHGRNSHVSAPVSAPVRYVQFNPSVSFPVRYC